MPKIFHILPRQHWEIAQQQGIYCPESLETEGFIHCSTVEQVVQSANAFFFNQADLLLLCIDSEKVQPEIKYEQVGEQAFPHIYGKLNLEAIAQVLDFPSNADGKFSLPSALKV